MASVTKIYPERQPVRRHFIAEWMELRRMTPTDLLAALNDPDRFSGLGTIDKSQVYRWMKGQLPHSDMQERIAGVLHLEESTSLFRHPDDDWFIEFFSGRSRDEISRMKVALEAAFPRVRKSGNDAA